MAEAKFDEMDHYKQAELMKFDFRPPPTGWMDTPTNFRPGSWIYPGKAKHLEYLDLPNPREWAVTDEDWQLPKNWKEIVLEGMRERLSRYRTFKTLLHRRRGSQEHAGHESGAAQVHLPQGLHRAGQGLR
jgi:hypothetical protein